MFPKIIRSRDKYLSIVTVKYLNETVGLQIDESRCQGCGTCNKLCPTSALGRGPIGGTLKGVIEKSVSTVVSPDACSYCGLCSFLCPWSAISLMKDGEKADASNIMDILTLVCKKDTKIRIIIEDPRDTDVLNAIVDLVDNGFGE